MTDNEIFQKCDLTEVQIQKRNKFEELYQQQAREREMLKLQKMERIHRDKDPSELMHVISQEFRKRYDVIREMIEKKQLQNVEDIQAALDLYQDLLNYYIIKNYVLTSFDKQQYKEQLDQLECSLYSIRSIIIPRVQFKFSKPFPKSTIDPNQKQKIQVNNNKNNNNNNDNIDQRVISPESGNTDELLNTKFNGGSLVIRHMTDRVFVLQGYLDTVYLQNLTGVIVDLGDVRGSVWVDKSSDCIFRGFMHQLRIHETHETEFIVYVTSKPIIEKSTALKFGQWTHHNNSGINYWSDVQDFNWLKQEKSPNFTLI